MNAQPSAEQRRDQTSQNVPRSTVTLMVNGTRHTLTLDNRTTLLDTLREHLALTGSKKRLRPRPVWRLHRVGEWRTHQRVSYFGGDARR